MAGLKHDEGKLDWHALPLELVELLVPVAVNGANKYGRHSILQPIEEAGPRHYSATMRHLSACQLDPLAIDPESGCYHAAHAAYDLLARLYQCELMTTEPSGYSLPPLDDGDDDPIVHVVPDRTSRNIAPTGVMIEQSEADLNRDLARADAMLEFARLQRLPEEKIIAEIEKQHRDEIAKIEREHLVHVVTDRTSRSGEVEASDWRPCPND